MALTNLSEQDRNLITSERRIGFWGGLGFGSVTTLGYAMAKTALTMDVIVPGAGTTVFATLYAASRIPAGQRLIAHWHRRLG